MAQENITIELPGSKGTAVIRSFVKNKDRRAVQRAALASREYSQEELETSNSEDGICIKISGADLSDVVGVQARALLLAYNGNTSDPYEAMLESEYEEDMNAVFDAVRSVFDKGANASKKSKAGK